MDTVTVEQYVRNQALVIRSGASMKDAVDQLFAHHASGAPVLDEHDCIVGFLSERDCIRHILLAAYHQDNMPVVDEVMTTKVTTLTPQDKIIDIAQLMINHAPKIYPVEVDGKYAGIITRQDVLRALVSEFEKRKS